MNISITNLCNRRCEYCFQKTWYLSSKSTFTSDVKEMDIEDFKYIVDTFNYDEDVRIMGGEPLLYSNIEQLLDFLTVRNKKLVLISNISVDKRKLNILKNFSHIIKYLMINCDYPKSQNQIFNSNYLSVLKFGIKEIALSTTLVPNHKYIINSAYNIRHLIDVAIKCGFDMENFCLRLAPYCPVPGIKYNKFDYTNVLVDFFNIVWSKGRLKTNFDCTILPGEIKEQALTVFKDSGIYINTNKCSPEEGFPVDILSDCSVIWCSSCNFIKLKSIKDYKNLNDVMLALSNKWNSYINDHNLDRESIRCLAKALK